MAMDLLGTRLTVLHEAPAADAALAGARLTVLHTPAAVDTSLLGSRLTVLHTPAAVDTSLLGSRLTILHSGPFQFQSAADAVAVGSPGLEKLGEIDFRTLTPTDIIATGVTAIDGIDFNVATLAASTTMKVDGNGLYLSGGTGVCQLWIPLTEFLAGFDGTSYKLVGLTWETDEPTSSTDWAVGLYGTTDWQNTSVAVRFGEHTIQWQRRRGGAISFAGDSVTRNASGAFGLMTNAGSFGRFQSGTWAAAPDPSQLSGIGSCGPGDHHGWTCFDTGNGQLGVWWDKGTGRNVRFKRISLWALREGS